MKFWLQYESDKPVSFKVNDEAKARELATRKFLRVKGTTYRVIGLMGADEAILENLIPIFWEELSHFEQLRRVVEHFKATGEWKN